MFIFFLLLILIVSLGIGRCLLRSVRSIDHNISAVEQGVFCTSLGLVVISYTVLALGSLGILYRWIFHVSFLVIIVFSRRELKTYLACLWGEVVKSFGEMHRRFTFGILSGLLLFHLIFNFVACLAPPTEIDALIHHLAVPKVYAARHGFEDMPSHIHSYLPYSVQMLFTLGLLLHSDVLAVLLHYSMGLLLVLSIFTLCRRWLNAEAGLLVVVIFYTLPMVTNIATTPHVDFGLVLFSFLSLYAFLMWEQDKNISDKPWLVLSGIFAGAAIGVKFIAAFNLALLSAFVLFRKGRADGWRVAHLARPVFWLWGTATLVASPWYIKTWILTGNPFFPVAYSIFGGKYWNATVDAILSHSTTSDVFRLGRGLLDYVFSPWRITMDGALINAGANGYGPIFLTFLPFLFIGKTLHRRVVRYGLIYATGFYTFLFFSYQYGRWFLSFMPWLSIAIACVIWELISFGKLFRYVTAVAVSAILSFHLGINIIYNKKFLPVVLGLENRDEFLRRNTWYYQAYEFINHHLPPNSKVLLWTWYVPYYLDRDYVIGLPTRQAFINYERFTTVSELLDRLKGLGITHILWDKSIIPETFAFLDNSEGVAGAKSFMENFYNLKSELVSHHLRPVYAYTEKRFAHRTMQQGESTSDMGLYAIHHRDSSSSIDADKDMRIRQ